MLDFFKKNKPLVIILVLGFILRIYNAGELFLYSHDQDLAGWFIKDVLVNNHLRLIGQETSTQGIFIGPLFYYLLIPFYRVFKMDPIGGVYMVALLGVFSIYSFYFVFKNIFNKSAGIVAAILYSVSFYTVFNDREVVPTMPVIVWTVWFLYGINLVFKNNQRKAFFLFGFLGGLIWHLNVALILTFPLIPLAVLLTRKKVEFKSVMYGLIVLGIMLTPLLIFEMRHNFNQLNALKTAMTTNQNDIVSGYDKFTRTVHLAGKNIRGFLWGDVLDISYEILFASGIFFLFYLYIRKKISRNWIIIIFSWISIYIGFFSLYSKILSEYYLNGMMVVWIFVLTTFIIYFLSKKNYKIIGVTIVFCFIAVNLFRFYKLPVNRSGYLYKKEIIKEIKADALMRGYPCVSVSYITDPGLNTGYRYFFWLEDMHVNTPDSGSPVYTIVYPLKKIFPVHKTFGSIGLIYPDYPVYEDDKVAESCGGENSNLTDPMLGYTE